MKSSFLVLAPRDDLLFKMSGYLCEIIVLTELIVGKQSNSISLILSPIPMNKAIRISRIMFCYFFNFANFNFSIIFNLRIVLRQSSHLAKRIFPLSISTCTKVYINPSSRSRVRDYIYSPFIIFSLQLKYFALFI